jgi:hypothetical protein
LAHHRQIDVLVVRMGDHEQLMNAEAKRVPRNLTHPIYDSGGANCEQTRHLYRVM